MASYEIQWKPGQGPQHVWVDEKTEVVIFEEEGKVRAFRSICPHMGAALEIREGKLFCPWHGLSYCLKTGESNHPKKYGRACEFQTRYHNGRLSLFREERG